MTEDGEGGHRDDERQAVSGPSGDRGRRDEESAPAVSAARAPTDPDSSHVGPAAGESEAAQALPAASEFRTLGEELEMIEEDGRGASGLALLDLPWLDRLDPRVVEFLRVGGALAVVLGLMFATRLLLRRAGGPFTSAGRPSGVLEILAKYPVGRGQSLILLKLARRILLVHQSGGNMRTLAEVSEGNEVAGLLTRMEAGSRSREASRFRETLRAFESEHEDVPSARLPWSSREHGEVEVVDLTRSQVRRLGAVLGRRRVRS